MNREYHKWYSPRLNREMELLIFGHAGARVLVFPTSMGRFFEWEDRGMIAALGEHLERGWIQLYCVDSVDSESWYCKWAHPTGRVTRHAQYEEYVLNEVLPLSRSKNPNPFLISTGTSFGAYHAVNIALRHPTIFGRTIGLSGLYDIRRWCDGYYDETIYFHNPIDYVLGIRDPNQLEQIRHLDIIIAVGADDPAIDNNRAFSQILWDKGIWHAFRLWDGWVHDWPWWREMILHYIGGPDSR
ncbi:MAG: alpha/beta hydrolase-fold protein [Ardenticatenaceae bacterium]|nr:alpha/beta hydrolase-fold protein [Ardenticatenaceae bacterium]HBY99519.1 esterase [Chloroflexota bacterium]